MELKIKQRMQEWEELLSKQAEENPVTPNKKGKES